MNFKDTFYLKNDRIFFEIEELVSKNYKEKIIIPESIILSLFNLFYEAFCRNDIIYMHESIRKLTEIAKKQPLIYFPELDEFNISQFIIKSLYLPNIQYHDSLLIFFYFAFQHNDFVFLDSFMRNGLFLSLIESISIFPGKETVLQQSFEILSIIFKDSKDFLHLLLSVPFINLFLKLFRNQNFSQEEIISIFSIISNIAQDELTKEEMNNLLILLRQIFDDKSISFMWEASFDTLYLLIANKSTAEYVMIEEEFYIQCSRIILDTNCINTIESIIYVLESYFKYTSVLFLNIETILYKIIELSKQNEKILYSTLCLLINFIQQGHLTILMNFDIFNLLKNSFQEGNYQTKKLSLKMMKVLIPRLTNEQIIKIIIPFNFMEDFVQILCAYNLHKIFNKSIGVITRLLLSKNDCIPRDIFWIQFEESGGVEILNDIANSDEQEFAMRAYCFLEKIYSKRPKVKK